MGSAMKKVYRKLLQNVAIGWKPSSGQRSKR